MFSLQPCFWDSILTLLAPHRPLSSSFLLFTLLPPTWLVFHSYIFKAANECAWSHPVTESLWNTDNNDKGIYWMNPIFFDTIPFSTWSQTMFAVCHSWQLTWKIPNRGSIVVFYLYIVYINVYNFFNPFKYNPCNFCSLASCRTALMDTLNGVRTFWEDSWLILWIRGSFL